MANIETNDIKNEIYETVKTIRLSQMTVDIPPVMDPEVCAQKAPDKWKVRTFSVLAVVAALALAFTSFYYWTAYTSATGRRATYLVFAIVMAILTIAVPYLLWTSKNNAQILTNNYERIIREIGSSPIYPLSDLAEALVLERDEAIEEIEDMIGRNYFKEARIIEEENLFILDVPTYRVYKKVKNAIETGEDLVLTDETNEKIIVEEIEEATHKSIPSKKDDRDMNTGIDAINEVLEKNR